MKQKTCPIADINSDYCCHEALWEQENYKSCYHCAKITQKQLKSFIKYLKTTKKENK